MSPWYRSWVFGVVLLGVQGATDALAQADGPAGAAGRPAVALGALLHQQGYAAIPFYWDRLLSQGRGYVHLDATVDTQAVVLGLDSGFDGVLSLDEALVPSTGSIDHFSLASVPVGPVRSLAETNFMPHTRGLLGCHLLTPRGAILDFASDTVYLRTGDTAGPLPNRAPRAAVSRTLRAVLESAGRYQTFLSLMQDAGLSSLLDRPVTGATSVDSLTWVYRDAALETDSVNDQTLHRSGQLTAFVPTDEAFAEVPHDTLQSWRADRPRLANFVRAHLLMDTRLSTTDLHRFIQEVREGSGSIFDFYSLGSSHLDIQRTTTSDRHVLGRASVVQPDLLGVNGIAHGIDRVLSPTGQPSALTALLERDGYTTIPIHGIEGCYTTDATVNDQAVNLLIDTGAPSELYLTPEAIQRLGLAGDDVRFSIGPVRGMPVAYETHPMPAPNQVMQERGLPPIDGILGAAFLDRYRARFDLGGGMVYFHFPAPPSP